MFQLEASQVPTARVRRGGDRRAGYVKPRPRVREYDQEENGWVIEILLLFYSINIILKKNWREFKNF